MILSEFVAHNRHKKILIIGTGGTISMVQNPETGALEPAETVNSFVENFPELSEMANLQFFSLCNIDSSDMNADIWNRLAETIVFHLPHFDGFVITHGTDTMAYSASVLSFLLKNLGKPVVFTGSQLTLSGGMRSDGRLNLANAILFAMTDIAEVSLCFGNFLYRGNRTTKFNAVSFDAFSSHNFPVLARIDTRINIFSSEFLRHENKTEQEGFAVSGVGIIKVVPGMTPKTFSALLDAFESVVIEGFGSGGNIPNDFLLPLELKLQEENFFVVLKSQCSLGNIDLSLYESGNFAEKIGVWNAFDMTTEAAFAKLLWVKSQEKQRLESKRLFETSVRGEME